MNLLSSLVLLFCIAASSDTFATTIKPRSGLDSAHTTRSKNYHSITTNNDGVINHGYRSSTSSSSSTGECLNNSLDNNDCQHKMIPPNTVNYETNPVLQPPSSEYLDDVLRLDENELDVISDFPKTEESSLRQVLIMHRHGDRTPIFFQKYDKLKYEPFWAFHGYGQLTNRGKARLYLLGQLIRKRYDRFMGKSVNKNQRISRSSGSLRCIESAQTFLAGFLSLDEPNSPDADYLVWDSNKNNQLGHLWQPGSVQSVPKELDGMLAESAVCNTLQQEFDDVINNLPQVKDIYTEYKHEAEVLSKVMGYSMDGFFKWFWAASQIEVERSYFENKVPVEILTIYDRVQKAGSLAMGAYQSTVKAKRLRSGLLMDDMIENMKQFRALGNQTNDQPDGVKKFVHYAAHDLTVVMLLGMLDSWEKFAFAPGYASNIIMELHEDQADNEWFVKIFYMPEVPSEPIEIHLDRCERSNSKSRCTLDKLAQLMSPYTVDSWQTWMKECNNDFKSMNPYKRGS